MAPARRAADEARFYRTARSPGVRASVAAADRLKSLPDVPSMPEAGYPDVKMSTWYGLSAPAGTPPDIIKTLHAALAKTLNTAKTKEKIESQGALIFQTTPDQHAAYLQAEAKLLAELIKVINPAAK